MEVHEMRVVFLNILALLLLFASLQLPPPQENDYPLQHRLFTGHPSIIFEYH